MPMPASRPPYSTSPVLDVFDCIEHGFFGRQGGTSSGIYEGLNCGHSSADRVDAVAGNRSAVAACFGLDSHALYSLRQAHTNRVVEIHPGMPSQFQVQADAMVTTQSGVALGVLGADCAPVLLVDPVNRVIGAAHSGWKGALGGVNEAIISAMCERGAQIEHIHAAIGPAMQRRYYEVKADFKLHFQQRSSMNSAPFFKQREGKLYFDTPAYIVARLQCAGIEHIDCSEQDTFRLPDKYFSYRRACQRGEPDYGRQVSVICLRVS